jgi:AbrB family looped-hinge helix DNA binding protein
LLDATGRKSYDLGIKIIMSEEGQVTIPKPLRDQLGLRPGTELDFVEEQRHLVARRVVARDAFSALVGLLAPRDVDVALTEMRGPGWRADLDGSDRDNGG